MFSIISFLYININNNLVKMPKDVNSITLFIPVFEETNSMWDM